jgi:hypothetical protein
MENKLDKKLDKLKTVVVSVRLDTDDYKIVAAQAQKDLRSFNNQIRYIVRNYIEDNRLKFAHFKNVKDDEELF